METFGLTAAVDAALYAADNGIIRADQMDSFASWMCDTYEGEDVAYVSGLSLNTLYGRFLSERAS